MMTAVASILVFSLLVLVHEYGHFRAAKKAGIRIFEFAIGMGPVIHTWQKNENETKYSLRLLPIGGFVSMEGEDDSESDMTSDTNYNNKSPWQRFKVIIAGPLMNFLLAIVIYILISAIYGNAGTTISILDDSSEMYKAGVRADDKILSVNGDKVYIWDDLIYQITNEEKPYKIEIERNGENLAYDVNQYYRKLIGISFVLENEELTNKVTVPQNGSAAYDAGMRTNDVVLSVDGIKVNDAYDVKNAIINSSAEYVKVNIDRDGTFMEFDIKPKESLSLGFNTKIEKSLVTGVVSSVYKTGYYIKLMFGFIGKLLTGQVSSDAVGGPVQVVSMIGESARMGMYSLLNLAAFISINLGFMNLLPIPALDGSKALFIIIEKIRGKRIPVEKEAYVHFAGFVILMGLMIVITYKDIVKLFG